MPTNREKQAAYKERMRAKGLVQVNEWVPADARDKLKRFAAALREDHGKVATNREGRSMVTTNQGPDLSAFSKPIEVKPRIRASGEGPIRAYGVEIWPAESPSYSFDDAWAAFQFWKTEDQILASARGFEKPEARGEHFLSQCDSLDRGANRGSKGFAAAWRKIAGAQYQNPSKRDDCCCPPQLINVR